MSPRPGKSPGALERFPDARASAVHASCNVMVQVLGFGMIVLTALNITPWPYVAGWAAVAAGILAAENRVLRLLAADGPFGRAAKLWAPGLRIAASSLFAFAALVLIARGGPVERLFAFAVISCSMVHTLMRYYRAPWVLVGAFTPYLAILGMLAFNQVHLALNQGHSLAALIATFTLATFALQFWSARAQLAAAWHELMSAREAAEQRERAAEAANRAKSNFLATMSHELRTPLNGVLGMVQALSTERLTEVQHERVRVIRRSSENLLAVLNDLLDLSKIEASALELEVTEFDLEHLVRGVVAAYQPQAHRKGLTFDFAIDAKAGGRYWGDSARIRRVLYSLADNAVKFTEVGAVTLSVGRDGEAMVFRVADTGIGIAAQDLAHLFEGFYQADAGRTRRYGGAGLGLAICREMSQLMGGAIEAESKIGAGSAFTLRIPLRPALPLPETARIAEPAAEPTAGGELRVLAAEDNDTNQLVLKTLLNQAGIEPTLVENGRQALEAWENQHWDMILMDIQMPIMDGVAATVAIRRREMETGRARTPIIAVTANAMTHQVAEYMAAGMDGMAPKPIDITALLGAMERALEPDYGAASAETAAVA